MTNPPLATHETRQSLWLLTLAPLCWAAHFLLCYITASIWCAKGGGSFTTLRLVLVLYTVLALAGIVVFGWIGYRRHRLGDASVPHDDDTPQDRHRFLGLATFLLAALSGVAVVYAAFVLFFFGSCY